jgi:hypothetical protein
MPQALASGSTDTQDCTQHLMSTQDLSSTSAPSLHVGVQHVDHSNNHSSIMQQRDRRAPRGRNNRQPRQSKTEQTDAPQPTTISNTKTDLSTSTASTNDDSDSEEDVCLICCEPIKEYAVGQCNHRDLCAMCTLKRRELYKENNCCICKVLLR